MIIKNFVTFIKTTKLYFSNAKMFGITSQIICEVVIIVQVAYLLVLIQKQKGTK